MGAIVHSIQELVHRVFRFEQFFRLVGRFLIQIQEQGAFKKQRNLSALYCACISLEQYLRHLPGGVRFAQSFQGHRHHQFNKAVDFAQRAGRRRRIFVRKVSKEIAVEEFKIVLFRSPAVEQGEQARVRRLVVADLHNGLVLLLRSAHRSCSGQPFSNRWGKVLPQARCRH